MPDTFMSAPLGPGIPVLPGFLGGRTPRSETLPHLILPISQPSVGSLPSCPLPPLPPVGLVSSQTPQTCSQVSLHSLLPTDAAAPATPHLGMLLFLPQLDLFLSSQKHHEPGLRPCYPLPLWDGILPTGQDEFLLWVLKCKTTHQPGHR